MERACSPLPASSASISIRSAAGGVFAAAARSTIAEGEFAKHAIRSSAAHVTPWGEVESRYADKRGALRAGRRLGCQARILRRSRRRRSARESGPPAGGAQARRVASDRDRSGRAPLLRRGRRTGHARTRERFSPPATGARRAMGPRRDDRRSRHARHPAESAARRAMEGHRRVAQGPRHRCDHARLRRARLRRRHRRRLDHDRRPPDRSHERRGRRRGRAR